MFRKLSTKVKRELAFFNGIIEKSGIFLPGWAKKWETSTPSIINPLAHLSYKVRGDTIERIARRVFEDRFGGTKNPVVKYEQNGTSPYDFLDPKGNRIEVKSGELKKRVTKKDIITITNVDTRKFDEMLLVCWHPFGLKFWRFPGNMLYLWATQRKNFIYWMELDDIPSEYFMEEIYYTDLRWRQLYEGKALNGISVKDLSQTKTADLYIEAPFKDQRSRPKIMEALARKVYELFCGDTKKPIPLNRVGGQQLYDFLGFGDERVEVKSAQCRCVVNRRLFGSGYFRFVFSNIKHWNHDRLILVFYFPDKLEFWEWDRKTGLSSGGNKGDSIVFTVKGNSSPYNFEVPMSKEYFLATAYFE